VADGNGGNGKVRMVERNLKKGKRNTFEDWRNGEIALRSVSQRNCCGKIGRINGFVDGRCGKIGLRSIDVA